MSDNDNDPEDACEPDDVESLDAGEAIDASEDVWSKAESTYQDSYVATVPMTEDGRIDTDLGCIHCGYNLRGHRGDGTCSECGSAVEPSLRTEHIFMADLEWVATLKRGLIWILVGIGTQIGLSMLMGVVFAVLFATSPQAASDPLLTAVMTIIASLIYSAIFLYATLQATAPEPGDTDPPRSREIARYCMLVSLVIGMIGAFATLIEQAGSDIISSIIQMIGGIIMTTGLAAFIIYMRGIAMRIPHPGLVKQSNIVLWGLTISLATLNVGGIILYIAINSMSNQQSTAADAFGMLLCPSLLGMAVFGIWWIVLLCLFIREFSKSLGYAR